MSRIETIRKLLEKSPDDTFLLYSLAMEYLSAGEAEEALRQYQRVLELDRQYLPAYQQMAKAYLALGQKPQAIQSLRDGIALAQAKGDHHAVDRMSTQLQSLEV